MANASPNEDTRLRPDVTLCSTPSDPTGNASRLHIRIALLSVLALALIAGGCAQSALRTARARLQAGDYRGAHQELAALAAHPDKLSPAELREVKDDLCITDYTIGRPAFSLREQQRVCADAAGESGSRSAEVLARVNEAIEQKDNDQIEAAIKSGDLALAEAGVEDYQSMPGADQVQVARWSNKMWKLVEEKGERKERASKAVMGSAIAALKREHADTRKMDDSAFKRWVIKTATVSGKPMVADPKLDHGLLKLDLVAPDLAAAALNLDKFAQINDAVVARCGCDGRTNIGLGSSDLPAYVVRLDPETRESEVLILLSGEQIGQRVSMR